MPNQAISLAPFLAVLIWAGNLIAAKISVQVIAPEAMAFYRALIAALILTPFLLGRVWKNQREVRSHWAKLAVLGLLGTSLYQEILYVTAGKTSATNMGIITSAIPLATLALSQFLLKERATLLAILGAILSLVGLLILMEKGHPEILFTQGFNSGDVLIVTASVIYALYGVLLQRWNLPLPLWESLYMQSLFGAIFLVPFYLRAPYSPVTRSNWFVILYAGLGASVFAPYLWMKGVKQIGSNRTSIFMNLLPLLTALIAVVMLRESLHLYHVAGGAMTICGVVIAQNWGRKFLQTNRKGIQA
jgi:drug/metabolite transporter (DMT)-like permease